MPDEQNEPTPAQETTPNDFTYVEQEPSTSSTDLAEESTEAVTPTATPEQPAWSQPTSTFTAVTPDTSSIPTPSTPPAVDSTPPLAPFGVTPLSSPTPLAPSPVSPQPPLTLKSPKKKGLLIGIIIVIILLLGAGVVLAYRFWYQNPEKVVTDAITHAITAKSVIYTGNLAVASDEAKVKIAVTGKQADATGALDATATISAAGTDYTVKGSALIDKSGDLYFKFEHLDDIVNELKKQVLGSSADSTVSSLIDQLKAKIDGTWIKVSSSDLKDFSDSYATTKTCLDNAVKTFQNDKSAAKQVTDLYKQHQFITIKKELGAKDGSLGYELTGNDDASKAFAKGLENTKLYKQLHSCDSSFTINADDLTASTDSSDKSTVTVWVSRWTHEFTKATIDDTSDGTTTNLSVEPTFNQPVTVTAPAKSTTLKQLESDIENLVESVYAASFSSSFDDGSDTSIAL